MPLPLSIFALHPFSLKMTLHLCCFNLFSRNRQKVNVIESAETESNQDEQSPSNQIITTPPTGAHRQTFDKVNSVILFCKKITQKFAF